MALYTSTPRFGRVITAMVTPFTASGDVDLQQTAKLADYLVENGSEGLVVCGTTGESPTLSTDEKVSLFKVVKDAVGNRAPIIAGTGSNNTKSTIELSKAAESVGVDGVLVVVPYYNKPSQEGLFQHFTAVANETKLPLILYNVPGRTVTNLEAATVERLAEHPRIVAIKEASANLALAGDIAYNTPDDFLIYSGADEVNLPLMALGSVGAISVISHVIGPDLLKMYNAYASGDMATATKLHLRSLNITKAMFSAPNPVPTKTALAMLDVLPVSHVRLPLVEAQERERAVIHAALRDYGLLRQ